MKSATTRTTEYDDFAGRKEQLRIAPCRRCAKIGKEIFLMRDAGSDNIHAKEGLW